MILGRKVLLRYLLFISFTVIGGCSGVQYSFQSFTFPGSIPTHESGWTYKGMVTVSTKESGSMFRKGNNNITIRVVDAKDNEMLVDKHRFIASSIKADITWDVMDHFTVKLIEHGSMHVDDGYSQNLAKTGERIIGVYKYKFNKDINKYSPVAE